jgi:hypothetical protein
MRFIATLIISILISHPVLADQKEERAAKAWHKRNEKKTLRQIMSPKILACVEDEMLGSVPISPDEKLDDVPEETILSLHRIYLDCKEAVEKQEKKRSKRGKKLMVPPQDTVHGRLALDLRTSAELWRRFLFSFFLFFIDEHCLSFYPKNNYVCLKKCLGHLRLSNHLVKNNSQNLFLVLFF